LNILAVDSATFTASVAVISEDAVLAERSIGSSRMHSGILAPMMQGVLNDAGLKPEDIGLFAVAVGPGSFTGLRIGISLIKAMSYALDKPAVGIPTLDSLAYNVFPTGYLVCPLMNARNSQVFSAVYRCGNDGLVKLTDYMAVHISEIAAVAQDLEGDMLFTGDAAMLHKQYLEKELAGRCHFANSAMSINRASSVALLARGKALSNEVGTCFDLLPFYMRKPQAERLRDDRDICRRDMRGVRDGSVG